MKLVYIAEAIEYIAHGHFGSPRVGPVVVLSRTDVPRFCVLHNEEVEIRNFTREDVAEEWLLRNIARGSIKLYGNTFHKENPEMNGRGWVGEVPIDLLCRDDSDFDWNDGEFQFYYEAREDELDHPEESTQRSIGGLMVNWDDVQRLALREPDQRDSQIETVNLTDDEVGRSASEAGHAEFKPSTGTAKRKGDRRGIGGRPPKYDWDTFAAELIQIANSPDGLPDRPTLTRTMLEWCLNNWGEEPAESLVRQKLNTFCGLSSHR